MTDASPRRPVRRALFFAATVAMACLGHGCAMRTRSIEPAATDAGSDVRALRYRAFVYSDDAMAAIHGAHGWIEELYLPEARVVCNIGLGPASGLKQDAAGKLTGDWEDRFRMNAFYGDIRNASGRFGAAPPPPRPVEEIRIPAETARAIVELANLNRKRNQEAFRLGEAMRGLGVLRDVKSDEEP